MNGLKLIVFNIIPLVLVLSSFYLLYTGISHWWWFLASGVISHFIVLGNLQDVGEKNKE
jgi:hypothetical protein